MAKKKDVTITPLTLGGILATPPPAILISTAPDDGSCELTPQGVRLRFAAHALTGLLHSHHDLGDMDDSRIVDKAFRIADLMTAKYFE